MKIEDKLLKKIRIKLAMEGVGSKGNLAVALQMKPSNLTTMLDTGKMSDNKYSLLLNWLAD